MGIVAVYQALNRLLACTKLVKVILSLNHYDSTSTTHGPCEVISCVKSEWQIQRQAKQAGPCLGYSAYHSNASRHLRTRHPGSSTLGMPASAFSIPGRGCLFTACIVLLQVEMWLVANEDVKGVCDSVDIHKGERILMEMSRKFTLEDIRQLAFQSNFYVQVAVCSCPTLLWASCGSALCSRTTELQSQSLPAFADL